MRSVVRDRLRGAAVLAALVVLLAGAGAADEDPYVLVERLLGTSAAERKGARDRLVAAKDGTLAAGVVDALFFAPKEARADVLAVLAALLGETHKTRYRDWVEAIGRREDIAPRKGYVAWKAKLLARIDPALAGFLHEDAPRTIRAEEIVWGGVKKDGIPALRNPSTIPAGEARYLDDDERVFGASVGGRTRAYPLRILDWHEMANDVLGGRTVSLSYCTLCGSGILFDTTLAEGETYTFGSSGLLYRSNKLMYDHQTSTLWSNLTGEPVMGSLAGKGKRLPVLPVVVTTWREWKTRHPDTDVLSLKTGYTRDYSPGAAYGAYFRSRETMFPVWKRAPKGPEPKDWVYAIDVNGTRKAYPLETLVKKPILLDRVAGRNVVLLTEPASEAVRAYDASDRALRVEGTEIVDQATGEPLRLTEDALVSAGGSLRLARLPGHRAYWFGWYAFFPGTELYGR